MIETFTALLFAHALGDFVLQTRWINANKPRFSAMLLHGAIVLVTAQAAIGRVDAPEIIVLALAHLAIDYLKTWGGFTSLTAYLTDQCAHLSTILAVSIYAPDLWQSGTWSGWPALLPIMAVAAGLILTLLPGQFAVSLLMKPHGDDFTKAGLKHAGQQIGLLERGLIFLFLLNDLPLGVGFLLAAKSLYGFGQEYRHAQYVIIGTLASFAWAIVATLATQALLAALPALETGASRP